MIRVEKDGKIQEVDDAVVSILTSRHGFIIVKEETVEDIRSKLDALGIEYHSQLGLKKLKILLAEHKA
jgi:hypothetical protein